MAEPSAFQDVVAVANGVLSIVACLVLIGAAIGGVLAWRALRRAGGHLAVVQRDVVPLLATLGRIADNLERATTTIHSDVEAIHETVGGANDRARAAIRGAEQRLRRLDAVVGAAQTEVEEALVDVVATARGLRTGAGVLRGMLGFAASPEAASEPPGSDSDEPATLGLRDSRELDGAQMDDSGEPGETQEASARRVRPRTRSRRT
jgi:hypothetical protein